MQKKLDQQVSEGRKKAGRIANGLITIVLGIMTGVIAMASINHAGDAGLPVAEYGSAFGLAVATMAAIVGRGFASIYRTGWPRLFAWVPILLAVIVYSSVFITIGNVAVTSFALVLAAFVGPIVQDLIEVTAKR